MKVFVYFKILQLTVAVTFNLLRISLFFLSFQFIYLFHFRCTVLEINKTSCKLS